MSPGLLASETSPNLATSPTEPAVALRSRKSCPYVLGVAANHEDRQLFWAY